MSLTDDDSPRDVTGRITKLETGRGFGFAMDEAGEVYFVHWSEAQQVFRHLHLGMDVVFDWVSTSRGRRAINVRLLKR
jgi:cold shock CspA family protein